MGRAAPSPPRPYPGLSLDNTSDWDSDAEEEVGTWRQQRQQRQVLQLVPIGERGVRHPTGPAMAACPIPRLGPYIISNAVRTFPPDAVLDYKSPAKIAVRLEYIRERGASLDDPAGAHLQIFNLSRVGRKPPLQHLKVG